MRVKAIRNYFDKDLLREVVAGEVIDVTEARATELCTRHNLSRMILCEELPVEAKPKTETKPKKGRPKKEVK